MSNIRQAVCGDLARIAEIVITNYRLNFYPIFKNDDFYFGQLQVPMLMKEYEKVLDKIWVYDDCAVKGFVQIQNREVKKLFVEPILQGNSIGSRLLSFAIKTAEVNTLWVLEKNTRAIRFYKRHGFQLTSDKKFEEGTTEFLVRMERSC